jgi:hypothetical protein
MKKYFFSGLLICFLVAGCAKISRNDLLGAWKMVQMQRVDAGRLTNYFSENYTVNQTKMWSESTFMFVGKYEIDTATSYRFGVGTYTLNGNIYVEDIKYHFEESYEGNTNRIWLDIRKDTLWHIFPVDERGNPDQTRHWIEKYVRVH